MESTNLISSLTPLLLLHVALLIRLSLTDRHLPTDWSRITFSALFSELIDQFLQELAQTVSSCLSRRSWSKVTDLFDGRLFAFTLQQLHQNSSKTFFDAHTMHIVKDCLSAFKLSTDKSSLHDAVTQLHQLKHIEFSSLSPRRTVAMKGRQPVTKINNVFIDSYLQPILTTTDEMLFDFVDPENMPLTRYQGNRPMQGHFTSCSCFL